MSKAHSLTPAEQMRYARHLAMPEFSLAAQEKLKAARVLVIGAGGLGCPLLLYLAAAGVGHIGIVDFDVVDESNLQRQILYTTADIGQSKAACAKARILALNPHITVTIYETKLTTENALAFIHQYDVVADGTDNFPTRYLVNDACVLAQKPNVFASILRFEGQVSVFNYQHGDGSFGPNYRDIFPQPPAPGQVPNCAEAGVLGVLPGIIGSMQACELIKVITGIGEPLVGRFYLLDAASFTSRILKFKKNTATKIERLIDYEVFCGLKEESYSLKEITAAQFLKMQTQNADYQLIDVRNLDEYKLYNIKGELLPLPAIEQHIAKIATNKPVIVHCQSGQRSAQAIRLLEEKYGFTNLYNLTGGLAAWLKNSTITQKKSK